MFAGVRWCDACEQLCTRWCSLVCGGAMPVNSVVCSLVCGGVRWCNACEQYCVFAGVRWCDACE